MRKLLIRSYFRIASCYNRFYNTYKLRRFKIIGDKPKIRGKVSTFGHGELKTSNNTIINSSLMSNPIGGMEKTILFIEKGACLEIGKNTGISNSAIICKKHIKIGSNVRIGGNTCIYDSDFHSLNLEKRISVNDDDIKCKEIEIKDGAFIGAHSIILKGVTIGENSIIGAGSVVTKNIPDNEIWGGNPAKFIRKIDNFQI